MHDTSKGSPLHMPQVKQGTMVKSKTSRPPKQYCCLFSVYDIYHDRATPLVALVVTSYPLYNRYRQNFICWSFYYKPTACVFSQLIFSPSVPYKYRPTLCGLINKHLTLRYVLNVRVNRTADMRWHGEVIKVLCWNNHETCYLDQIPQIVELQTCANSTSREKNCRNFRDTVSQITLRSVQQKLLATSFGTFF